MFLEIDKNKKDSDWSMVEMHSHSYFEVYFIEKGERLYFIDNEMYNLQGNMAAILPPFTLHKTEGGPFSRITINFSEDFLTRDELTMFEECASRRIIDLSPSSYDYFGHLETLFKYHKERSKTDLVMLAIEAKYLLFKLYEHCQTHPQNIDSTKLYKKPPSIILKVIKEINDNYVNNITLKSLSDKFHLSTGHLSRLFKENTGFGINDYILKLRINRAKQLLLSKKKYSVEEIAYRLGFSSANYFGLVFKSKVGLSPLNFRRHK